MCVTIDPQEVVAAVSAGAHRRPGDAPALLSRSPEPRPPLPGVQSAPEMAAVHREWARVHADDPGHGAAPVAGYGPSAVRAKVRAKVVTVAGETARSAQQDDRALIGDLIRAVDAVARRVDELGDRLGDLEALVQEVVAVTSEDLVQVLAALGPGGTDE